MFSINQNQELTEELLQKMLNKYLLSITPILNKYKKYYNGQQIINDKSYTDTTKPCNHTVINYCKNIVDSYTGYIASPSYISYRSENDIEDIMNVLRYNDYQAEDCAFLQQALIYGVAAELMYVDSNSKIRFRLINPLQCFGIYDDSLSGDLLYFVRFYKIDEWNDSDKYNVDVYSDNEIKHYTMNGLNGFLHYESSEPHYFSQCPANIFYLQDEKSIFDCVISLQDAVNELVSSEIDDYSAFCDAYLTLIGVDANAEDVQMMKENRVLVLPEGASAAWLTKNANDAQVENILKRIHDSIYRVAQCPDFSAESFVSGVSSGIAIRYRLTGMENKAAQIESLMKKALQRRVEIISGFTTLLLGEAIFRDISIDFKRNIPEDIAASINVINSLRGFVSDATLLTQIPFITDVNAELELIQEQKQQNMALYAFGKEEEDE